jgi:hypothetical protein
MRDHFKHVEVVDYALLRSSGEMSRAEDGATILTQRKRAPDQTWPHKKRQPTAINRRTLAA